MDRTPFIFFLVLFLFFVLANTWEVSIISKMKVYTAIAYFLFHCYFAHRAKLRNPKEYKDFDISARQVDFFINGITEPWKTNDRWGRIVQVILVILFLFLFQIHPLIWPAA